MIKFVVGKPGGGKSLYAVVKLIEELRSSNRCIITNLALKMEPWVDGKGIARKGLLRTLKDKYGDEFDAHRRIVLLDDQKVRKFFLYRRRINYQGEIEELEVQTRKERVGDGNKVYERFFLEGSWGCYYVIDEVHEFYNSRMWTETGTLVLSWASQSRRSGDDALLLTQHPDFVETNLKKAAQECTVLVNHRLMSASIFRQPDMISFRDYAVVPPKRGDPSMRSGKLEFKRQEIYGCYDTAAGVGVSGSVADIGKRASGLHWSFFPLTAIAIIMMLAFGCRHINQTVLPKLVAYPNFGQGAKKLIPQQAAAANQKGKETEPRKVRSISNVYEVKPDVFYQAHTLLNGKLRVYLSDGRVLDSSTVLRITDAGVQTIDGFYKTQVPAMTAPAKQSLPLRGPN